MNMQMINPIPDHKRIHVHYTLDHLEHVADPGNHAADRLSFNFGQFGQPRHMPLWFYQHMAQVSCALLLAYLRMPDIDQSILIDSTTGHGDLAPMLAADKTAIRGLE